MSSLQFLLFADKLMESFRELYKGELRELLEKKDELTPKIYELTYLLQQLSNVLMIPNINVSLINNQMKQKGYITNGTYFKPIDYQYNFLLFMCLNYPRLHGTSLSNGIEKFIDTIVDQLNIDDIVLLKTGATGCYTNVRFSLVGLRETRFVKNGDNWRKSNWLPTFAGFFAAYYFLMESEDQPDTLDMKFTDILAEDINGVDIRLYRLFNQMIHPDERMLKRALEFLEIIVEENYHSDQMCLFPCPWTNKEHQHILRENLKLFGIESYLCKLESKVDYHYFKCRFYDIVNRNKVLEEAKNIINQN